MSAPNSIFVLGNLAPSLIGFRGDLLREMVANGCRVTACAPAAAESVREELNAIGVDYLDIPLQRTGMNPWHDGAYFLRLVRQFRRRRPDVLFAYTIKPAIYGSLAAAVAGVPVRSAMITGLGYSFSAMSGPLRIFTWLVRSLYRLGLRGNRVVFFQNPDDLNLFRRLKLLGRRTRAVLVNGSGINTVEFSPAPMPPEVSFLFIARLIREKGICDFVDAARVLRRMYPGVRCRVVGWIDGSRNSIGQDELDGWVKEGVIDYLGKLDDVRPAIADSSIFVLPSYYREGVPRTILEAMAMGRAVVTTDAPGCRETIVPGRNGFLVPVRDVASLVQAMERFLLDPALALDMGAESRRLALQKFDVRKVNRQILESLCLLTESGHDDIRSVQSASSVTR